MDDPLNRRMTIALLALLPLLILIWASLRFDPSAATELPPIAAGGDVMQQLAALPGSPNALPPPEFSLTPPASGDPRALNAAIPFIAGKLDPAPPYSFKGNSADFTNARDCLALAAMAEAGIGKSRLVREFAYRDSYEGPTSLASQLDKWAMPTPPTPTTCNPKTWISHWASTRFRRQPTCTLPAPPAPGRVCAALCPMANW